MIPFSAPPFPVQSLSLLRGLVSPGTPCPLRRQHLQALSHYPCVTDPQMHSLSKLFSWHSQPPLRYNLWEPEVSFTVWSHPRPQPIAPNLNPAGDLPLLLQPTSKFYGSGPTIPPHHPLAWCSSSSLPMGKAQLNLQPTWVALPQTTPPSLEWGPAQSWRLGVTITCT